MKDRFYIQGVVAMALLVAVLIPTLTLAQQYAGSGFCLNCHSGAAPDMRAWLGTGHSHMVRDADRAPGVIPDSAWRDTIDLNTDPDYAAYVPNAPILSYVTDPGDTADLKSGYRISFGNINYHVNLTVGGWGYWKQRYLTKIGNSHYFMPIQYNEIAQDWKTFDPEHWYNPADSLPWYTDSTTIDSMITKKNAWERRCSGCHTTGTKLFFNAFGDSAYTVSYKELSTGCEGCHGPYNGSHSNIIHPDSLSADRANEVCGRCHIRGASTASMGGNTFGFPWRTPDSTGGFIPGDSLGEFFVATSFSDMSKFWPDSTSKSHHQQFIDFYRSAKPTFQFHKVRCYECHEPHGKTVNNHMIRDTLVQEDSIYIPTEVDNNTICLACHATHGIFAGLTKQMIRGYAANLDTIRTIVKAHTHHLYDPENASNTNGASRCSKCHMPKVAKSAKAYDIHSHTFHPNRPEATLAFLGTSKGNPNACAVSCHRNPTGVVPNLGVGTDPTLEDWREPTDSALAKTLLVYYGPNGIWWSYGVEEKTSSKSGYMLSASNPNPFTRASTIKYAIPRKEKVILSVYDLTGRVVKELVNATQEPGYYTTQWDGRDALGSRVATGIYFYRLEAGKFTDTRKMILLK